MGRRARDTFASLKKMCRRLGVNFWAYLQDRVRGLGQVAPAAVDPPEGRGAIMGQQGGCRAAPMSRGWRGGPKARRVVVWMMPAQGCADQSQRHPGVIEKLRHIDPTPADPHRRLPPTRPPNRPVADRDSQERVTRAAAGLRHGVHRGALGPGHQDRRAGAWTASGRWSPCCRC